MAFFHFRVLSFHSFCQNLCALRTSVVNLAVALCLFAKRIQFMKSLTPSLSMRNAVFSAILAQKTNPKRTQFSAKRLMQSSPAGWPRHSHKSQNLIYHGFSFQSISKQFKGIYVHHFFYFYASSLISDTFASIVYRTSKI